MAAVDYLDGLNSAQKEAACFGVGEAAAGPLLIVAGAGSGKTKTLAHRVAHLVCSGADPQRILLLTFSRRAAQEMCKRSHSIVAKAIADARQKSQNGERVSAHLLRLQEARLPWAGTFHAIANRLLRLHAESISLDPNFTLLDRSDASDFMDLLRGQLGLAKKHRRFPKKGTCMAIYSRVVNAQSGLGTCLKSFFPWCEEWEDELRTLFRTYTESKQKHCLLDYDDLLLYWYHLLQVPALADQMAQRFDHILVDEYQDTNRLQAEILSALSPSGRGLTAVGDDAQSIYSFRSASVRNILDFPKNFSRPAQLVSLEQNYRSTQPILAAANAVISLAPEGFSKTLFSDKISAQKPYLVTAEDEHMQVEYVVEEVLKAREAAIPLKRQAVLFRASHHSDALEVELSRRNIPYRKFGGLKFLEAAHVKDMLCILRWAENPLDPIAAYRVLQLIEGIGPATAKRALEHLERNLGGLESLITFMPPAAALSRWPGLVKLLSELSAPQSPWQGQVEMVRHFYEPILLNKYDSAHVRQGDLDQLQVVSEGYTSRERFLSELTLDPPNASGDWAGPPKLDEDYLNLSTIHSAKGQEWDSVYLLNCADGCLPSDLATGDSEQIEEERRLLYVAMTRAKSALHLVHPLRFYVRSQHKYGDKQLFTPLTRFLPASTHRYFDRRSATRHSLGAEEENSSPRPKVDVSDKLLNMW